MKFLFITGARHRRRPYLDHAVRYRCYNRAEDLNRLGHVADVCSIADWDAQFANFYDFFIFNRPAFSRRLTTCLSLIERRGKRYCADYDDLIFDVKNALQSPLYVNERASRRIVLDLYEKNLRALKLFDRVVASTVPLGEEVSRSHPRTAVAVVHNGLSKRWVEGGMLCAGGKRSRKSIVYLSGTGSHGRDFQIVEDCLAHYVNRRGDVELKVFGELTFDRGKFGSSKVSVHPNVDYSWLPEHIKASWVTIAPLQDNRFNRCKSGLKFFESAVFGVPCVASPIPDMQRFARSGIGLARGAAEWNEAFEGLEDPQTYGQTAHFVREYARENCMSMQQTEMFMEAAAEWMT